MGNLEKGKTGRRGSSYPRGVSAPSPPRKIKRGAGEPGAPEEFASVRRRFFGWSMGTEWGWLCGYWLEG
jgi:hypothetical protein